VYDKRIANEPYLPSRKKRRIAESNGKKVDSLNVVLVILFLGSLASLSTINRLFFQSIAYPELILIGTECAAILLSFLTVIRAKEWHERREEHVQLAITHEVD